MKGQQETIQKIGHMSHDRYLLSLQNKHELSREHRGHHHDLERSIRARALAD
ncbi:hypothetical protein YC2023_098492 [Brassica napus]